MLIEINSICLLLWSVGAVVRDNVSLNSYNLDSKTFLDCVIDLFVFMKLDMKVGYQNEFNALSCSSKKHLLNQESNFGTLGLKLSKLDIAGYDLYSIQTSLMINLGGRNNS